MAQNVGLRYARHFAAARRSRAWNFFGLTMSLATWITFFLSCSLIAVSPGSGAVLSMSHGLAYGVRHSGATILGLQAGLMLVFGVAGAGVGSLLLASELAFSVVKTVGALYLIWLGFSQWRAKPGPESAVGGVESRLPSVRRRFLTGFFTNATNPKGILFMMAVLPQFFDQSAPLGPQLLVMGLTMVGVDLVVMHGYAFAASTMQRFFQDAKAVVLQNRVFGGLLMAVGAGLFFVKRGAQA